MSRVLVFGVLLGLAALADATLGYLLACVGCVALCLPDNPPEGDGDEF